MDFDVFTFENEIEENLIINTNIEQIFYNIDSFLFDLISLYNASIEIQQNKETQTQMTNNSWKNTNDNNKHPITENFNDNLPNNNELIINNAISEPEDNQLNDNEFYTQEI